MTTANLVFTEYLLPAYWASALINDDWTGTSDEEEHEIKHWLDWEQPGYCCSVSDEEASFHWKNDATDLGGDCLTFTFQKEPT